MIVFAGWSNAYLVGVYSAAIVGATLLLYAATRQSSRPRQLSDAATFLLLLGAYSALVGFPYYAVVYVAYIAPLVVLGFLASSKEWGLLSPALSAVAVMAVATVYLVASGHYGYWVFHSPGIEHAASPSSRATLDVQPETLDHFALAATVGGLSRGHPIWAGPNLAHIYFLTGARNPTRHVYEFAAFEPCVGLVELLHVECVHAIVIDLEPRDFAPRLPVEVLHALRIHYEASSRSGSYEVRWTSSVEGCASSAEP